MGATPAPADRGISLVPLWATSVCMMSDSTQRLARCCGASTPCARRAGSEIWKGADNAADGGGAVWVAGDL